MLSDQERKTLRDVQRHFEAEDPGFTRHFDDLGRQHSRYSFHWPYAMPRWAYTIAIVVAVALGVLMVVAGAPGTALLFAALATVISVVRRRWGEPGRRES